MSINEWGNNKYYSEFETGSYRHSQDRFSREAVEFWERHLQAVVSDAKEKVTRSFRAWNLIVRDQLRNETGFRLTHADQQVNVPVKIMDGIPYPLQYPLWEARETGFLLLHRNLIAKTKQGVGFVKEKFSLVTDFLGEKQAIPHIEPEFCLELESVHDFLRILDSELNKVNLLSRILSIEEDILGAYFFQIPQVRIYWLAIGIVALMLDVEIEALTVVVLAHELAHAYTHLGRDIDGRQWNTEHFAATDASIVEGLAQYYTQAVCKKLAPRFPSALNTFETLLKRQSAPYTGFSRWIEGRADDSGEFVRHCMIQTRSLSLRDYEAFYESLILQKPMGRLA